MGCDLPLLAMFGGTLTSVSCGSLVEAAGLARGSYLCAAMAHGYP